MQKALIAALAALSAAAMTTSAFAEGDRWGGGGNAQWNHDQNQRPDSHQGDHRRDGDRGRDGPRGGPPNGGQRHEGPPPQAQQYRQPPHEGAQLAGGPHEDAGRDRSPPPNQWSGYSRNRPPNTPPNTQWSNDDHRGDHDDRAGRPNNWPRGDDHNRGPDRYGDRDRYDERRYADLRNDPRGPRYDDWRRVPPGRYFNDRYAGWARSYYGHAFYWWDYPGWRRPYRPYRVGYILPPDLYWDDLPYDFYGSLPPPPYGCRYIAVDHDVLLIVVATGLVLDALIYDGDWRGHY